MRKHTIGAAEFKARCLELMDQVAKTGNAIVITKRGKPVARLAPVAARRRTLVGALKGHIRITGDIVEPLDVPWDAAR
jgi:prevent-host-death family protein